jgi:hypothetical protein
MSTFRLQVSRKVLFDFRSFFNFLPLFQPTLSVSNDHPEFKFSIVLMMRPITSLMLGNVVTFHKSEYKIVSKLGTILQFGPDTFPVWMTEGRFRNTWRPFSTSKPETSVLSFLPNSIPPFLVHTRREFEIVTPHNSGRISAFAIGLSPLLKAHRAAGRYVYNFEDDQQLFMNVINFLNGESVRITPESVEGFRKIQNGE